MESKFKEGEVVYARTDPDRRLIIRRCLDAIYYCKIMDDPKRVTELVYFERELVAGHDPSRRW